jgi:enediyne biosynthesis protein E4
VRPEILSAGGIAGAVLVAGVLAWVFMRQPAQLHAQTIPQSAYIPPSAAPAASSPVRFTNVTQQAGIDFRQENGGFVDEGRASRYMPESMGPGVALFDFDGDEDLDIFVPNSLSFDPKAPKSAAPTARLYRNEGEWRFTDATESSGLGVRMYGMGASAADYDGDGDSDLLMTAWGGMRLMQNRSGRFVDVTRAAGLEDKGWRDSSGRTGPSWPTSTAFFDADGDGLLDLFVAYYVQWSPEVDVYSTMDGARKSYAKPDLYHGSTCRLFLQRAGRFVDATEDSGVFNDSGKALGVTLWDFNRDGRLDIAVANDTQPNFLFESLGGGKFIERGLEAGIAYDENGGTRAGMGIDAASVDNDDNAAIAIGNFSREPVSVFKLAPAGVARETSQQSGVAAPTYLPLTFGLQFADLDLDGWQDLVTVNGHIEPIVQEVEAEVSYRQPLVLLGNDRRGRFVDWSAGSGAAVLEPIVGRGLAVGDIDADGDLDMVISENNGPLRLLRNDTPLAGRRFLRVTLEGSKPNTDAIGASLELEAGGITQRRVVRTGSSYMSQSELTQTFGVPEGEARLRIVWPDGAEQIVEAPAMNSHLVIDQRSAEVKQR